MNWYLFGAIALIVFFVALFFISFVHNRKTPPPKGCEHIKIEEENCMACNVEGCNIREKFEYDKLKEELKKSDKNKGE